MDKKKVHDSLGELEVPADALYGAQTQRAANNFAISGIRMPRHFIEALGLIKAACAATNQELGLLDNHRAAAIVQAATEVAAGHLDEQFIVDVFQTGSGTSTNMNANEVISTLASRRTGSDIHPNDHVNMSQSSNDVIPTAVQVSACLYLERHLLPALNALEAEIVRRANELTETVKTGRTHLMDAMPVTLSQELLGWAEQIHLGQARVSDSLVRLRSLPLGGTAVGTGVNAPAGFSSGAVAELSRLTGLSFSVKHNLFEGIATQDAAVEMSGQLNTLAVSLTKICNDLRWMNSGPLAGLAEIQLPVLQPGSSIMPGKVNPVIPEAVLMAMAQVIGNHTTITLAGQSGNFQLNVMLPVIAYNLLQSIELICNSAEHLARLAIAGFTVNEENLAASVSRNPILVTALNSVIGYDRGAAIAKRAYAENRPLLEIALEDTALSEAELRELLDPLQLTRPG